MTMREARGGVVSALVSKSHSSQVKLSFLDCFSMKVEEIGCEELIEIKRKEFQKKWYQGNEICCAIRKPALARNMCERARHDVFVW